MGSSSQTSSHIVTNILLVLLVNVGLFMKVFGGNLTEDFDVTWGDYDHVKILNDGELISLTLDKDSGSGFQSKNMYLFGNFNMRIKLVPGDSSGTVTTYYLWSNESKWDEIDIGFFGNNSGEGYIIHTNVVTKGKGNREQQFYLWFDPSAEFHTYSILWNPRRIIFSVDDAPIRVFKNLESDHNIPYPNKQAMKVFCSIMSLSNETDWNEAPFTSFFYNFDANESCPFSSTETQFSCNNSTEWLYDEIDLATKERVRWVQNNYMIYNYCSDVDRFPEGLPQECDIG